MYDVNYPNPPKYYIAWSGNIPGDIISYGKIESDQCLTTGLNNMETFIEEQDFISKLSDFGISL